MTNFLEYNPEQAYLLPPSVRDVLGEDHLCFFVHRAVEKLDLRELEAGYSEEGHPAYHPALLLKVWLYAYALGMTSSRRLEQRIREDLAFRYLAGGAQPDFWALNEFRKRHGRALNDIFTQVVELARSLGLGKLGHVAIDSTRIAANASTSCTDSLEKLRVERAKIRKSIRRWQQQCASEDPNEGAGLEVARAAMEKLQGQLREIPARLQRLKKAGVRKLSRTDTDSRFLPDRRGFTLGYTATLAVSDDHLIVAQQISRELNDNGLLMPMVDQVQSACGERPGQGSADSGFFSVRNLEVLEKRGIDAYVPDSNMACVLHRGGELKQPTRHPALLRMRSKLCSMTGRAMYRRRKAVAEPVMGILKEQRGMRRFRMRGLRKVAAEFALATTALNLTRMWRLSPPQRYAG
ncbi:MAG TPA: IS1182 family transposase [Terriglobales bacterium]|nr:IS1182 family transposase [Terriglobales bacterium]